MHAVEGTLEEVVRGEASWCVVHGDALHVLRDRGSLRVVGIEINADWAELARERVRADLSGSDYAAWVSGQRALFG